MSPTPDLDRLAAAVDRAERTATELGILVSEIPDLGSVEPPRVWFEWFCEDPFSAIAWDLDRLGDLGNGVDGTLGSLIVFEVLESYCRLVSSVVLCWSAAVRLYRAGVDPSEIPSRIAQSFERGLSREGRRSLRVVVDYVEIDLDEIRSLGWTSTLTAGLILWFLGIGSQDPIRDPLDPEDPEVIASLVDGLERFDAALQDAPEDLSEDLCLLSLLGVDWLPTLVDRNRQRTADAILHLRGTEDEQVDPLAFRFHDLPETV